MSRMSEHHIAKCGVVGKCSVPMWGRGLPSGFCDEAAYGEQYAEGGKYAPPHWSLRDRNGYLLNPHLRAPYAPGLCCKGHGGPGENDIRFVRDGDMWCAFLPGFVNLQESIAGFGQTQAKAEADLRARIASGTSASGQDPQGLEGEAPQARPDAQTPPQSPSYSKHRGSVEQ